MHPIPTGASLCAHTTSMSCGCSSRKFGERFAFSTHMISIIITTHAGSCIHTHRDIALGRKIFHSTCTRFLSEIIVQNVGSRRKSRWRALSRRCTNMFSGGEMISAATRTTQLHVQVYTVPQICMAWTIIIPVDTTVSPFTRCACKQHPMVDQSGSTCMYHAHMLSCTRAMLSDNTRVYPMQRTLKKTISSRPRTSFLDAWHLAGSNPPAQMTCPMSTAIPLQTPVPVLMSYDAHGVVSCAAAEAKTTTTGAHAAKRAMHSCNRRGFSVAAVCVCVCVCV